MKKYHFNLIEYNNQNQVYNMVYFEKSYPAPSSLTEESKKINGSYKKEDVLIQLKRDFFNKCQICDAIGLESTNIEHFAPHKKINNIRKFNWSNLFWACSHCNQIKSSKESLLNCTVQEDDVDKSIRYFIDDTLPFNKIIIEPILNTIAVENTVQLLNDVYAGTTPQNELQATEKRNRLYDEVSDFTNYITKYFRIEDEEKKEEFLRLIVNELKNRSAFTAFKRYIVRSNPILTQEFKQYIGD